MGRARSLLARFAIGLLVVVALAEVGARIAETAGPEALRWYDASTQLKVEQMDALGDAEVVFAGTSMVWQGMVPDEFAVADGRSSYNAGLAGGVPEVMERWLLEEVVPRLEPDVVVWGLSSLDFSATYGADNRDRYDDALETRDGALAGVERGAASASALVRYRGLLRDPGELFANGEVTEFELAASILGNAGVRRDFEVDTSASRGELVEARLYDYAIDAVDVAAIHRTVTELESRGIDVVLVKMPTPDRYTNLHPAGQDDIRKADAVIDAVGDALALGIVDLTDGYVDADFVDFTHLDEAASADLTRRLASALGGEEPGPMLREPFEEQPVVTTTTTKPPVEPAVPLADLVATANRVIDVNDLVYAALTGVSALAGTEVWFGAVDYGHTRDLVVARNAGEDFDVVFMGSSMMLNGADPAVFEARDGRSAYNVSFAAAGPEIQRDFVRGPLFDLVQPELVVYGIAPRDVRALDEGNGCLDDTALWDDAQSFRRWAFAPIAPLENLSRDELFFGMPPTAEPATPTPAHLAYRETYDDGGGRRVYAPLSDELRAERLGIAAVWQQAFDVCDERLGRFANTVRLLTDAGVDVVVVAMPIPDFRAELFPRGRAFVDKINLRIANKGLGAGAVAYIDLSDAIEDDDFRDVTHVDLEGSIRFTELLVDELAALGL